MRASEVLKQADEIYHNLEVDLMTQSGFVKD
jgi:hypothetical protein